MSPAPVKTGALRAVRSKPSISSIPSGLSLVRLRIGFLVLGLTLLSGLAFLSILVQERLNEARRDREEMVALRVFDELEREASLFLDSENERPPYVDLKNTDPKSWAPFVVGYFKQSGRRTEQVPADGPASENQRRITWSLNQARAQLVKGAGAVPRVAQAQVHLGGVNRHMVAPQSSDQIANVLPEASHAQAAPTPSVPQKKEASGSEIIGSLNRAQVRRKGTKSQAPQPSPENVDQFSDYKQLF